VEQKVMAFEHGDLVSWWEVDARVVAGMNPYVQFRTHRQAKMFVNDIKKEHLLCRCKFDINMPIEQHLGLVSSVEPYNKQYHILPMANIMSFTHRKEVKVSVADLTKST
jgi:hypothetical protein